MFQVNKSWFFCYDYFVRKPIQKNNIALNNTCVDKNVFICVNKLLNARVMLA